MLHLFKKVYIEFDTKISIDYDRIVISESNGVPMLKALDRVSAGELIAYGHTLEDVVGEDTTYPTLVDLLITLSARVESTNKTTIIFADETNYLKIVAMWFKMLLPNATAESVHDILESHVFREEMFSNSRFSLSSIAAAFDRTDLVELPEFKNIFQAATVNTAEATAFVASIKPHVSVEYLFASYMYDGSNKEEFKASITPLISKDLEKYLYELKEIVLVHILLPQLQEQLSTSQTYTFENLNEIVNDTSPLVSVFFKPEIWNTQGLVTPTSAGSINFANVTAEDIENIRQYAIIVGSLWEEEKPYSFIKSDIMKLDFIPFLQDDVLSDASLDAIIGFELVKEHSAGSYNSISIGTVNHYLVDHIIFSYTNGDIEAIKPFIL